MWLPSRSDAVNVRLASDLDKIPQLFSVVNVYDGNLKPEASSPPSSTIFMNQ